MKHLNFLLTAVCCVFAYNSDAQLSVKAIRRGGFEITVHNTSPDTLVLVNPCAYYHLMQNGKLTTERAVYSDQRDSSKLLTIGTGPYFQLPDHFSCNFQPMYFAPGEHFVFQLKSPFRNARNKQRIRSGNYRILFYQFLNGAFFPIYASPEN